MRRRLRPGPQGRGLRQGGTARRYAGLHEPGASPGRRTPGRWPFGPLQPGGRPVRAADRPEALPGRLAREVLDQIATGEPRPLRHIDDTIPRELEGSVRKALRSVRRSVISRAGTWPTTCGTSSRKISRPLSTRAPGRTPPLPPTAIWRTGPATHRPLGCGERAVKIVPKGLRSFDRHDADFFLEAARCPERRRTSREHPVLEDQNR